ncbi:SCO family protein [Glaciecola siphonariae]|uniref:SCO family protein n=1 Tax=Glaciecola siphonariae TaxID=521012 RepID=A0ABV9LQ68_9ALTE
MQQKWIGLIALFSLILGVYLAITIAPPGFNDDKPLSEQTQHLNWYPQARALTDFELSKHDGSTMTNADLTGQWTLAFVGYTFCPDICPVTLAQINNVYPQLQASVQETPLRVWFLSVDPNRDTVERLNEYVSYFNPDFIATTGPHIQLFPLVRSMGMMYSTSESTDNPNYLVDHSASIVVINPEGNVVGRFKPKHIPGELAISDVDHILADMPILLGSS